MPGQLPLTADGEVTYRPGDNDNGDEYAEYEGADIAVITPANGVTRDPGACTVDYGTFYARSMEFDSRADAETWLEENAGDLADPDYRDSI